MTTPRCTSFFGHSWSRWLPVVSDSPPELKAKMDAATHRAAAKGEPLQQYVVQGRVCRTCGYTELSKSKVRL